MGFIVYGNSLPGTFVGDDFILIMQNINVHELSFESVARLFTLEFFDITNFLGRMRFGRGGYYRPLCLLSFAVDYQIWHFVPFGYHLTNIILHIFGTIAVYLLALKCMQKKAAGFIVAALFLVHPIHSRYVASISGRTDLLCFIFSLLTVVFYAKRQSVSLKRSKNWFSFLSLFSFACALLSKEMAIMFPFVIILYDACFKRDFFSKRILNRSITYAAYGLVLILYLTIRSRILNLGVSHFLDVSISINPWLRMITVVHIIVGYLVKLLIPLNIYYSWHYVSVVQSFWTAHSIIFVLFVSFILWALFKSWRHDRVIFFGIGWFFITYFTVSNVIPLYTALAEHSLFTGEQFLHIPMVGFIIVIVRLFMRVAQEKGKKVKTVLVWLFIGVVIVYSLMAAYYNIAWNNAWYYNVQVIKQDPWNAGARNDLGIEYMKDGCYEAAANVFRSAITAQEKKKGRLKYSINPYLNLVKIYCRLQNHEQAKKYAQEALLHFPNSYLAFYFMASIYSGEGKMQEAIEYCRKALYMNPLFTEAKDRLREMLNNERPYKETYERLIKKIEEDPQDDESILHLADMFRYYRMYYEAALWYDKYVSLNPKAHHIRSNLSYCYRRLHMAEKARQEQRKIEKIAIADENNKKSIK